MKKVSFLVLSVLTLSVLTIPLVSAQKVNFGLKAGLNRTSINDEQRVEDTGVVPRLGFHAGGLAHFHLSEKWALQPEMMYSKEGAEYETRGEKSDINCVNVPILIQYMVGPGFRLETGPQFGQIVSAKYEDKDGKEFKKFDIQNNTVAWTFGVGYLSKFGIGLDIRYNWGLSNIYIKGLNPNQYARTRAGQLGLFYQFK